MSDRLSEIEGRLAAATPGPWKAVKTHKGYPTENYVVRDDLLGVAMQYALVWQPGDAEFIAHAPVDLAALVKFAREVEALHKREDDVDSHGRPYSTCSRCLSVMPTSSSGRRHCRTCKAMRARASRARKRELEASA